MKVGITVGVFDLFHLGHLRMLKNAKLNCDFLIVGVHHDKLKIKNVQFAYTLQERIEFVNSIKFVDKSVPYEKVDDLLLSLDFDIFFHGPDQQHQLFQNAFRYCSLLGKQVMQLERTDGVSSSELRNVLSTKEV